MLLELPVLSSTTLTVRMLFSSTKKLTLILGVPALAGGIPDIVNLPKRWLSSAMGLSPWNIEIYTAS